MKYSEQFRIPPMLAWTLLLAFAVVLLTFALGGERTLGTHEAVAAVPAREMVNTGDWIVPRYATVPRLQKPPVVYWLIAINGWVLGSFDEFVVRLHSVFAALSLLALMSYWAARWYGREAAFGAALIQATSIWVLNYGRHAEIDMFLCLTIAASLFLVATQSDQEAASKRRLRWLGILSLLGLSWLCKFHYGPAMVLGPTMVYWAIQRRWDKFLDLFNPIGILVVIGCVVIWPWLVWQQLPEAMSVWKSETIGRQLGEWGRSPWWYYLPSILTLTTPWTFNAFIAAPSSLRRAWSQADGRERFIWTWLVVDLGIAWLSPDKHDNYLLAAMPPVTLLACQSWAWLAAKMRRGVLTIPKFVPLMGAIASVSVGAFVFAGVAPRWPVVQSDIQLAAIGLTATFLTTCWWGHRQKWSAMGWTVLTGLITCYLLVSPSFMRMQDRRQPTADFARKLRREVLHDDSVCVYGLSGGLPGMNPVAFYLQDPVCRVQSEEVLRRRLHERSELLVLVEQRNVASLSQIGEVEELAQMPPNPHESREPLLACVRLRQRTPAVATTSKTGTDHK